MKHTELPWGMEVTENDIWIGPMRPDGVKVNEIVFALDFDSTYRKSHRDRILANAAFIVHAVNNHYKLVEALREARAEIYANSAYPGPSILKDIDAALASATGGDNGKI